MGWIVLIGWLARLILVFLFLLSIWSISIILERRKFFQAWKTHRPEDELKKLFSTHQNHALDHVFEAYLAEKFSTWRKGLGILATLGSTTPFVGLLGTILGIIVSFGELSQGQGEMKAVMFSLAEALVLTAVGLGVAIPAVVAFNNFNQKIKTMVQSLTALKEWELAKKKGE